MLILLVFPANAQPASPSTDSPGAAKTKSETKAVWPNGTLTIGPMQIAAPQPAPIISAADLAKARAVLESVIDLRKPADNRQQICFWLLDENGNEIQQMDYTNVGPFSEGLSPVTKLFGTGYVNGEGVLVIPTQFGNARKFSEGLAWAHSQAKGNGYIDHEGRQVIASKDFFDGMPFSEGLAAVGARVNSSEKDDFRKSGENLPGKWGYIDKSGNFVTAPYYDQANDYHQNRAAVKRGEDWLFIDERGAQVGESYQLTGAFSEGLAPVRSASKWGFITREGKLEIPCQFEDAQDFSESLAAIKNGGKYGFINDSGKVAIKPIFKNVDRFSQGLCAAQSDDGKWGFIDQKGSFIIAPTYTLAKSFSDGRALVQAERKCGLIDKAGKYIIQPKYDYIFPYCGNRSVAANTNWNHPMMRMALMEMHLSGLKMHMDAESPTGVYIPADLADALKELDEMLPRAAKDDMKMLQVSEMNNYHLGFAMGLRNNWGLWKQSRLATYLNAVGLHHPDDMSATILNAYWSKLHQQPFDLAAEVAHYDAFWHQTNPRAAVRVKLPTSFTALLLSDATGKTISLDEIMKKTLVTVLAFCDKTDIGSSKLIATLNQLRPTYKDTDVKIVIVTPRKESGATEKNQPSVQGCLRYEAPASMLQDIKGLLHVATFDLPQTVVIESGSIIRYRIDGFDEKSTMKRLDGNIRHCVGIAEFRHAHPEDNSVKPGAAEIP
jgi:hypothetical protein